MPHFLLFLSTLSLWSCISSSFHKYSKSSVLVTLMMMKMNNNNNNKDRRRKYMWDFPRRWRKAKRWWRNSIWRPIKLLCKQRTCSLLRFFASGFISVTRPRERRKSAFARRWMKRLIHSHHSIFFFSPHHSAACSYSFFHWFFFFFKHTSLFLSLWISPGDAEHDLLGALGSDVTPALTQQTSHCEKKSPIRNRKERKEKFRACLRCGWRQRSALHTVWVEEWRWGCNPLHLRWLFLDRIVKTHTRRHWGK